MKRAAKYGLTALLAATLIGAGVWGAWLLGTADGARWIMDQISRRTPLAISAGQVEGRLLDRLRLGGVRIARGPFTVEIDHLDYRWEPLSLLSGRIAVRELTLTGVRIRDNTPAEIPPDLTWPRLSGMAALFDGVIERLAVDDATYRLLDGPPIHVDALSTSVVWQRGLISLSGLAAASPEGRISGSIAAGFDQPDLQTDLTATLARPIAGMDAFSLRGRFLPGHGAEQLAGRFTMTGSKGKANTWELSGEAGMTARAFNFRLLHLAGPGRRGSFTGGGSVTLTSEAPLLALQATADGLDLSPEIGAPTDLSGTLTLAGTPKLYRGEFSLANRGKGWRTARLSGAYQGDGSGVKLAPLSGSLLAGSVQGSLDLRWERELSLEGTLRGRNLDPAGISPDWAGVVNFDIAGEIAWPDLKAAPRGKVSGRLLESRLHGQPLTAEIEADFAGSDLSIGRLALRGKGFDIQAAGTLARRLEFSARINDLGRLIPRTAGELRADGWVRWRDGRWEGAAAGRGGNWSAGSLRIAAVDWSARLGEGKGYPLHLAAKLHGAAYDRFRVDSVSVEADGTVLHHTAHVSLVTMGAEARISCAGAYFRGTWQGEITHLSGRDGIGPWRLEAPASLVIASGRVSLSTLALVGVHPERIEIAGRVMTEPLGGSLRAAWNGLNLSRANPWLSHDLQLDGRLTGRATAEIPAGKRLDITGQTSILRGKIHWSSGNDALDSDLPTADLSWRWQGDFPATAAEIAAGTLALSARIRASAVLTMEGRRIHVEKGSLSLDGSERGWNARADCTLAGGGTVQGTFSSPAPVRWALPETGDVTAEWTGIDTAPLRPWLPHTIDLEGLLSGRAAGSLLSEQRLSLKGELSLSGGKVRWASPGGEIRLSLRSASILWGWQGEAFRGDLSLALTEHGQARGSFQLPIPARRPAAFDRRGPLLASLSVQVQEKGVLSSLFPGLIRESSGEVDADLRVGGTWEEPSLGGNLKLSKAGAYLPTAGIHVSNVELAMRIEKEFLRIDSFRAVSGPGHIEGSALVRIAGWRVAGYSGSIHGEKFQLVYFPELQIQASPRLTFEGTTEKLAVRGEMLLPELLIIGPPTRSVVQPSRDVILEGAPKPPEKAFPLALDVQVRLTLGERVVANLEGIDAQLAGGIDLTFQNLDKITSKGEIRVAKGRYKAYGVDLQIARGRLFYAGGPINQPTLDILALRTVGEVRAGVSAGGILRAPVIKLYSEPAMPDVDVLAYIVFGRPLGKSSTNSEQAGMMAQVASVLLSKGQSVVLQEQIKNRLGLSTLEIESGGTEAAGRAGYKEIPTAPAGVAPVSQSGGLPQTMLTVGKYLTPELYFSYGRSLFTGGNLFRLRYDLFKRWQIETQTGSESGADLYYKIEFD